MSKSKSSHRVFSRAFKLGIVNRMLAGEKVRALARELRFSSKDLYIWRDRFVSGGPEALRGPGRPRKSEGCASTTSSGPGSRPGAAGGELEAARGRGAQGRPAAGRTGFFSASLAASRGSTPTERRVWGTGVYALIEAMTSPRPQGELTVERMCVLAGVNRAGYYRHWSASAPRQEETAVRDAVQRAAIEYRHYGYRRIAWQILRDDGLVVNHKRVLRLMRQDNLLCLRKRPFVPVTTDSRHAWHVVPNLARGLVPTGLDQLWVADITYVCLREEFAYLAVVLDAFSRRLIGWALDTHLRASLTIAALGMAIKARRPTPGAPDPSLRSRRAVRLLGVYGHAGGPRHPAQHEPRRQSLRQRQGGELQEDTQAGGG